ncbi:MAG: glycosyltransferase [Fusobacteriaceae bacterium]
MKISVLIPFYDKYDFLYCVLNSLERQTFKDFEVIIAEDCEKTELVEKLDTWKKEFTFTINKVSQEDIGFRKNKIMNKGILASKGKYIVVIDGDCMVHEKFLENYMNFFEDGYEVIYGRRCELSEKLTNKILKYNGKKNINIFQILFSKTKKKEEAFYSLFLNKLLRVRKIKELKILGSNMGFTKELILSLNGFNEEYEGPGVGEDSDLAWRFTGINAKYISGKSKLIQYHLYHERDRKSINEKAWEIYIRTCDAREFKTKNGIEKL